eukprot:1254085-Prymnesium_polylepis.1
MTRVSIEAHSPATVAARPHLHEVEVVEVVLPLKPRHAQRVERGRRLASHPRGSCRPERRHCAQGGGRRVVRACASARMLRVTRACAHARVLAGGRRRVARVCPEWALCSPCTRPGVPRVRLQPPGRWRGAHCS